MPQKDFFRPELNDSSFAYLNISFLVKILWMDSIHPLLSNYIFSCSHETKNCVLFIL